MLFRSGAPSEFSQLGLNLGVLFIFTSLAVALGTAFWQIAIIALPVQYLTFIAILVYLSTAIHRKVHIDLFSVFIAISYLLAPKGLAGADIVKINIWIWLYMWPFCLFLILYSILLCVLYVQEPNAPNAANWAIVITICVIDYLLPRSYSFIWQSLGIIFQGTGA